MPTTLSFSMQPQRRGGVPDSRVPLPARRTTLLLPPSLGQNNDKKISVLNNAIQATNFVKDWVPLEVAKGALSSVITILNTVKVTISNQDDFQDIAHQCYQAASVVWRAFQDTSAESHNSISPSLHNALSDLQNALVSIYHDMEKKSRKNIASAVFNVQINQDAITKSKAALTRFLSLFNTELNVSTNLKVGEIQAAFEEFQSTMLMANQNPAESDDLPPPPSVFVGRDDLVQEAIQPLLNRSSVALIGPGGMGKTTIARAVTNQDAIVNLVLADILFNLTTWMLHKSLTSLGIKALANVHGVISKTLSAGDILLVLDNAESFLDAAVDSEQIVKAIDGFGARANVAIVLTTRTTVLPPNVAWIWKRVPALEKDAAIQAFRLLYHHPVEPSVLSRLLSAVDYHPLSINLLAQAAIQNEWTPEQLMEAWDGRRANLLENGGGKAHSLAVTIETSMKSPSVTKLGSTIRDLLQVIAILPQGVSNTYLTEIFPTESVSDIRSCAEVLCKHSLAYQKNDYITLLAPIRLYIMGNYNKDPSYIPLFDNVLRFYGRASDMAVLQDDINIEHVAIFLLKSPIYIKQETYAKQAMKLAEKLSDTLYAYKPRLVMLHKIIIPLDLGQYSRRSFLDQLKRLFPPYDRSLVSVEKGECLVSFARSSRWIGQIEESDNAWNAAREIFLHCGNSGRRSLASSYYHFGTLFESLGDYCLAEEYLKLALKYCSRSLVGPFGNRPLVSYVKFRLGWVALWRGQLDASKTILSALSHFEKDNASYHIFRLLAVACAERVSGQYEDAEKHLEQAESMSIDLNDPEFRLWTLFELAEVAELQRDRSQAKAYLSVVREIIQELPEGKILPVCDTTMVIASHAAMEGDVEQAREMVAPVIAYMSKPENLSVDIVDYTYGVGCIELFARDLEKAKEYFKTP